MIKLNVGCADVLLGDGWTNMDLIGRANVVQYDARKPLPYGDNTVDFMYSEHFIEHITVDEEINFFKEAHRVLKPGGVIRTSTFDIDDFIVNLHPDNKDWTKFRDALYGGIFSYIETRAQLLSLAVHEGGVHKYCLNPEELTRLLSIAGFNDFTLPKMRESTYPELQNLEYRPNSNCIVEAIK